jgi:hypothetical protein
VTLGVVEQWAPYPPMESNMIGIRTGRKEILEFMGKEFKVYSWRTVIRWRKKGMPVTQAYNTQPIIIEEAVKKWFINCFK